MKRTLAGGWRCRQGHMIIDPHSLNEEEEEVISHAILKAREV